MFHVSILCLLVVSSFAAPLRFGDSGVSIEIRAQRVRTFLEMSLTIYGGEGTTFILISEALSPKHKQHSITLSDGQIKMFPDMKNQDIIIRDHEGDRYFLAFRHQVGIKQMHFMPIRIVYNNQEHDLFLSTFDLSMSFLPESSFYKCDEVLVSLQHLHPNQPQNQQLEITLFTKNLKQHNFYLTDQWDNTWRHYDDGVYFGGATQTQNLNEKFKVYLSSRKICEIDVRKLPEPGNQVDLQKYYEIKDLLKWAPALPLVDMDEEL